LVPGLRICKLVQLLMTNEKYNPTKGLMAKGNLLYPPLKFGARRFYKLSFIAENVIL